MEHSKPAVRQKEMLGCPDASLLGSEDMSLVPAMGGGGKQSPVCVALTSDPDTTGDSRSPLSFLGEEVVTRAMALGHSGFSSCSLPFVRPPSHSAEESHGALRGRAKGPPASFSQGPAFE